MKQTATKLNLKHYALASIVPVTIMLIAMAMKPLWRDEYYTLYHGDPTQSFGFLTDERWGPATHPPAYYFLLWCWNHLVSHVFLQKCLSLIFLILGALSLKHIVPDNKKRTLYIFMLTALGSWWVIYFATEIRPYILNFTLSSLTVFLTPHLMQKKLPIWALITWGLTGAVLALTHYFSGLWFASLSLVIGIYHLKSGSFKNFVTIGITALVGMLPLTLWLLHSLPRMQPGSLTTDPALLNRSINAAHQFLRGLLVKTFGSNPLITVLGFGGLVLGLRGKNKVYSAFLWAALLTIIISFTIHITAINMIKERAFMAMMPAILYIFADHVAEKKSPIMKYLPWVTAIMPFIFLGEYFKNKEKLDELKSVYASYGNICEKTELLVYYRPKRPHDVFVFSTEKIMNFEHRGFKSQPVLTDLKTATEKAQGNCPVKAVGLLLRHTQRDIQSAGEQLKALGYDMDRLTPKTFGKGRNILWIEEAIPEDK